MKDEVTLFYRAPVRVTSSYFIVGSKAYFLRDIVSVEKIEKPLGDGPAISVLLGIVFLILALSQVTIQQFRIWKIIGAVGIYLVAAGISRWRHHKPNFAVVLTTAGGRVTAYVSNDGGLVGDVVDALNNALANAAWKKRLADVEGGI